MSITNLFLGFEGRISRQPFWLGFILLTVAEVLALMAFGVPFFPNVMKPLPLRLTEAAVELVVLYPTAALAVKRLHDRDQPGSYAAWLIGISLALLLTNLLGLTGDPNHMTLLDWVLSLLVLGIALVFLIELGFRRGTPGENRYGPDPLGGPALGGGSERT
jgi:uncharacterized membrane protein YhaH (DUF805 family)